jgi:hypothetical protein
MSDQQSPDAARQLGIQLALARPMRRGSLSERYMKCGQLSCRCQQDPEGRHGPYFSLTRGAGGTTRSRYLSEAQAKLARVQIEAGQQFRKQVDEFWEACERWADAELEASEAASKLEAEKGGSKRPSRRKSSMRSKR